MEITIPDRFKNKGGFYEKMLRLLVKDFPETWASFDAVVADMDNFKTFVHKIKGASGNLDMTPIYETALAFEATLRSGAPDAEAYKKFTDACDDLKASLPPAS